MAIPIPNNESNFAPVPAGTYVARCFKMVHIGTVLENMKGKQELLNKIFIWWELPTEQKEFKEGDGLKPYTVGREFTLSMNEKSNLRKILESWRGSKFTDDQTKNFDVTKLLGVACMISIGHKLGNNGKTYAEVTGVSPLMRGMHVEPQINETFELNYENFTFEKFNTLPDFIKTKMKGSNEFKRMEHNEAEEYTANEDKLTQENPIHTEGAEPPF